MAAPVGARSRDGARCTPWVVGGLRSRLKWLQGGRFPKETSRAMRRRRHRRRAWDSCLKQIRARFRDKTEYVPTLMVIVP